MNGTKNFSTKTTIILALLVISIGFNVAAYIKLDIFNKHAPQVTTCDCFDWMCTFNDGERLRGDETRGPCWAIPNDSLRMYRKNFRNAMRFTSGTTYTIQLSRVDSAFFISKKILNFALNNTYNGIYCHLGYDTTYKHLLLLIKPGQNTNYSPITPRWVVPEGSQIYEDRIYCPPQCSEY